MRIIKHFLLPSLIKNHMFVHDNENLYKNTTEHFNISLLDTKVGFSGWKCYLLCTIGTKS